MADETGFGAKNPDIGIDGGGNIVLRDRITVFLARLSELNIPFAIIVMKSTETEHTSETQANS